MSVDVHTISINGAGSGLSMPDRLRLLLLSSAAFVASAAAVTVLGSITAGTGFTTLPIVAPSGGTGSGARARATSLKVVTATVLAPGTGVAINDTFTVGGGTLAAPAASLPAGGVAGVLTATHVQAVSGATNGLGSGGTPGAVTLTGTSGTGTKFQMTGTIAAGGALVPGSLVVTVPGDYTVAPTSLTAEPVTGGGLTGATVAVALGALTFSISTAGSYSAAPPTANTPTDLVGTGTGVTATLAYGLGTAQITNSGNYSVAPSFTVTAADGNGSGASIATATLGGSGNPITVGVLADLPSVYVVQVTPNVDCRPVVAYKSNYEVAISLYGATTLAAGVVDVLVLG